MQDDDQKPLVIAVDERAPGVSVVALAGELDLTSADQLIARLSELARRDVVVDLAAVTFVDSSGLNALVAGARGAEEHGGSYVLAAASPHVLRLFEVVRLRDSVVVEATVEEALQRGRAAVADGGPPTAGT